MYKEVKHLSMCGSMNNGVSMRRVKAFELSDVCLV